MHTIIAVNRFTDPTRKQLNRLILNRSRESLDLGNLVSVVCHRGDVNQGHFVSYHRVDEQWFLNDDSMMVTLSEDPLCSAIESETIEILFFKKE